MTPSRGSRRPKTLVVAPFGAEVATVSDEEAWTLKLRLAREEGILAGTSSGAAAAVALRLAADLGPGKLVARIFPDTGERYFSMAEWFPPAEARR